MATDRNKSKSNTKSSSSGNKKTARAADTSKRASQDRQAEKKKGAKEEKKDALVTVKHRSANTREITAIVMVSVCIFVVVCMLGKAGIVGSFVRDVLYGVFGLVGTILLLIAVLVLSFSILRGTQSQTFTGRTTATMIFFFLFLTALFHSLSNCFDSYVAEYGQNYKFLPVFLSLWKSHEVSPFGGGLIAGGVATALLATISKVGALVVLIPLTLIFAMLLFKFSLLPFFTKVGDVTSKVGTSVGNGFRKLFGRDRKRQENTDQIKVVSVPGDQKTAPVSGIEIKPAEDGKSTEDDENKPKEHYTDEFFTKKEEVGRFVFDEDDIENSTPSSSDVFGSEGTPVDTDYRGKVDFVFDGADFPDVGEYFPGGSSVSGEDATAGEGNAQGTGDGSGQTSFAGIDFSDASGKRDAFGDPVSSPVGRPFGTDDAQGGTASTASSRPRGGAAGTLNAGDGNDGQAGGTGDTDDAKEDASGAGTAVNKPDNTDKTQDDKKQSRFGANDLPVLNNDTYKNYVLPSIDLLKYDGASKTAAYNASLAECSTTKEKLIATLKNYGVEATCTNYYVGPTVTRYEIVPKVGIRMNRIKELSDEIAFYLAAETVRIEAPIPGKSAVGIEVPNKVRSTVFLREIIASDVFKRSTSKVAASLGKDILGNPVVTDIEKMPHLLIGGTTGSGKSVCTNGMIMSILFKASPDEVRFILIDPKSVEFLRYDGLPHLLLPVVTDPKKAASALAWATVEMDRRYAYFAERNVKDITDYNALAVRKGWKTMPKILIFIDELADLMMVAGKSVEFAINRIAQKARACGMHLIVATQRPSRDVVTGLIKANIPSRICLKVADQVNSQIILNATGGEKLLGKGDMIFAPAEGKTLRIQNAFTDSDSVEAVVNFIKSNTAGGNYDDSIVEAIDNAEDQGAGAAGQQQGGAKAETQDIYKQVVEFVVSRDDVSISKIQRQFNIGYNKAANYFDKLVDDGYVERSVGGKPGKVIRRG